MDKARMIVAAGITAVAIATAGSGTALAAPPDDEKRVENCGAVNARQVENGQIGTRTGSSRDPKQDPYAVTNCDGYWTE